MPQAQRQQMIPFRYATRRRRQPCRDTIAFTAGGRGSIRLPQVGFITRLFLTFTGTVNVGAGASLADLGPWNLIKRMRFSLNLGNNDIVDVSGWGGRIVQQAMRRGFEMGGILPGATAAPSDRFAAGVAAGNNTWRLNWVIPIAANNHRDFELGAINLQAEQLEAVLNVDWGAVSDAVNVAGGTGISNATLSAEYEYFEVPDPRVVEYPPLILCRTFEKSTSITSVGETAYQIERAGRLLSIYSTVRLNGARSESVDYFELKFNRNDSVERLDRPIIRTINAEEYGSDFPSGVWGLELWNAQGLPQAGDLRDAIDTEVITTPEWIAAVSSGATLGVGNNEFLNVRRYLQAAAY